MMPVWRGTLLDVFGPYSSFCFCEQFIWSTPKTPEVSLHYWRPQAIDRIWRCQLGAISVPTVQTLGKRDCTVITHLTTGFTRFTRSTRIIPRSTTSNYRRASYFNVVFQSNLGLGVAQKGSQSQFWWASSSVSPDLCDTITWGLVVSTSVGQTRYPDGKL